MLSTRQDAYRNAGLLPNEGWSRRIAAPTVLAVAKGEDADRRTFRRQLGIALGRARTKLTTDTQQTIADFLGVDVETVGRWERGEREPKTFELHRMAVRYRAPGEWFLYPTDSISELDLRIEQRRLELLQEAAEAAQAVVAEESARRGGGGRAARPGRSPRGTRSR